MGISPCNFLKICQRNLSQPLLLPFRTYDYNCFQKLLKGYLQGQMGSAVTHIASIVSWVHVGLLKPDKPQFGTGHACTQHKIEDLK